MAMALAGMNLSPVHAATQLQPTGKMLQRWSASWMVPKSSYTVDEAIVIARAFDLVIAQLAAFAPYVDEMHAANPNLTLLGYVNGMWSRDHKDGTPSYPLDWYARDVNGDRIYWTPFRTYLMSPTEEWTNDRVVACANQATAYGYDGCFLDNLGTSAVIASVDTTGVPVDPATGQPYTKRAWLELTSGLGRSVKAANPDLIVTANGIRNGSAYFNAAAPTSGLADAVDAAMDEAFVRAATASVSAHKTEVAWRDDVDMLVDAGAHHRKILAITKMWTLATQAQRDAWHTFVLATFLLGTDGSSYFQFLNDDSPGASTVDHPWDRDQLGLATDSYAVSDGVYVRRFEKGLVLANPTSTESRFTLDQTYTDVTGTEYSGDMILAPYSGYILRRNVCAGDTTPPSGSFTLSHPGSDSGYTSTPEIEVDPSISDVCAPLEVALSNDGEQFSTGYPYVASQPSIAWTVEPGDGTKNVWARFRDAAGNSVTMGPVAIVLDARGPTAPADVRASIVCSGSQRTATLEWEPSEDTAFGGYRVYRSADSFTWALRATTTLTTYADSSARSSTVIYRMVAFDHAGNTTAAPDGPYVSKNQCG